MKLQYDTKEDAVYIDLAKGKYRKTRKITESVLVDEDESGKILGIEILDAKENIAAFNPHQRSLPIQSK